MKLLVTGNGTGGSFEIRGRQLGAAIGAHVEPKARRLDGFDAAIVVKKCAPDLISELHRRKVPVIYDIVDAWPQPEGNYWDYETALWWLSGRVAAIRPAAIVAATRAMTQDCARFGLPTTWVPHHARPGQAINPIRQTVRSVGYEGCLAQLGRGWLNELTDECDRRGWVFHVNPLQLADVDIVVALRGTSGVPPRRWKSGVKLANAQGSGTPIICCKEAGYLETASGGEQWADSMAQVWIAFDALTPREARMSAHVKLRAHNPTLERVAAEYREWLSKLNF